MKDRLDQLSQKLKVSQDRLMQLSSLEQESASRSQDLTTPSSLNQLDSNSLASSGLDVDAICSAFDKQRTGLTVLTDILTKNIRDVQIIKKELNLD